jgi:hypothetical protein
MTDPISKTVDLPPTIQTTRDAVLWARDTAHTFPGDQIVVHQTLVRTEPEDYNGPVPVQLICEGRMFRGPNPFDAKQFPLVTTKTKTIDETPLVEGRAAQHPITGVWYPGQALGLRIVGGNDNAVDVSWTKDQYRQNGFWVDDRLPYASLNAATLCEISNTWGDAYYGPGTMLACKAYDTGRYGRVMHWPGSRLINSTMHDCVRAFSLETARRASGIDISGNTFGGRGNRGAGYISCPVGPGNGYDFGLRFNDNHSTETDVASGAIRTMTTFEWDQRLNFAGVQSYDLEFARNRFTLVGDHIKRGMVVPALALGYITGARVHDNVIPCNRGPFVKLLDNASGVEASGNVGSYTLAGLSASTTTAQVG